MSLSRRAMISGIVVSTITPLPALARSMASERRLRMYEPRRKESLDIVYYSDGRYDCRALGRVKRFMRDWRNNKQRQIDKEVLDILWQVHQHFGVDSPYTLLCGYRSPETNEMLRRTTSGVAKNSLHLDGKAADVNLPGVRLSALAQVASAVSQGGVGLYSRSDFVHLDCGEVRTWGS